MAMASYSHAHGGGMTRYKVSKRRAVLQVGGR